METPYRFAMRARLWPLRTVCRRSACACPPPASVKTSATVAPRLLRRRRPRSVRVGRARMLREEHMQRVGGSAGDPKGEPPTSGSHQYRRASIGVKRPRRVDPMRLVRTRPIRRSRVGARPFQLGSNRSAMAFASPKRSRRGRQSHTAGAKFDFLRRDESRCDDSRRSVELRSLVDNRRRERVRAARVRSSAWAGRAIRPAGSLGCRGTPK